MSQGLALLLDRTEELSAETFDSKLWVSLEHPKVFFLYCKFVLCFMEMKSIFLIFLHLNIDRLQLACFGVLTFLWQIS